MQELTATFNNKRLMQVCLPAEMRDIFEFLLSETMLKVTLLRDQSNQCDPMVLQCLFSGKWYIGLDGGRRGW